MIWDVTWDVNPTGIAGRGGGDVRRDVPGGRNGRG